MNGIFTFAAGFAAGWLARSTADSSHEAAVGTIAFGLDLLRRARRIVLLERERIEDFVAEVHARLDDLRGEVGSGGSETMDSAA